VQTTNKAAGEAKEKKDEGQTVGGRKGREARQQIVAQEKLNALGQDMAKKCAHPGPRQ